MISFGLPSALLLLFTVPALVWLRTGAVRKPSYRFSDVSQLYRLRRSWTTRMQPLLPLLYGLGLVCLIIVLAQPQRGLEQSLVKTEVVDIVLAVDLSTSMRAEDFSVGNQRMNRYDSVREVLKDFIRARSGDRMAIVAFAAVPYAIAPLTLDNEWLQQRLDDMSIGMLEDGTAIGSALASAVNRLRDSAAASRLVVLLTDGENNMGTISPEQAAQAAAALGIRVYTIGAGTDGWVPIPFTDRFGQVHYRRAWSEIDEPTLKEIARVTGGGFFRATDHQGLKKIYEEIDRMERTEVDVEHYTQFEPRFLPFLIGGLFCLGLEKLLALSRLGRLP